MKADVLQQHLRQTVGAGSFTYQYSELQLRWIGRNGHDSAPFYRVSPIALGRISVMIRNDDGGGQTPLSQVILMLSRMRSLSNIKNTGEHM